MIDPDAPDPDIQIPFPMKPASYLIITVACIVALSSCDTGLFSQMDKALDEVEQGLGYVNTLETKDVRKMADWFDRRGDDGQKGRAFYCLGRNQFNDGDFPAAIVTYIKALEYSVKAADTLRVARICYDMAHTCNASGNSTDEMMYLARSAEAFKVAGFQRESQQALLEIGQAESGLGRYGAAEDIFKSVLFDAHEMRDTLLEARCLESYAALAMSKDTLDPALAIDLLSRAARDLDFPLSFSDKGILAYAYSVAGKSSESQRWLLEARATAETDAEIADVNFREYQISSRGGDSKKALASLEKVMEYANRTQSAALSEAVAASQRDYIQGQAEADRERLLAARLKLWVLALGALLALAAVSAVYFVRKAEARRKLEAERLETEKFMNIAEDLQARLSRPVSKAGLKDIDRFNVLERLCEQYYVYEGTDNLQPKILKEVKSIVEGLRGDRKTQRGLENMLDQTMDNVMSRLRGDFPSWKEDDFLLFCFTAAGFSSTTISALMGKDKSVIYNRVWRLKGRISASDSPQKEFFLSALEKK